MFIHKNTPLLITITFTMQITTWMFKNPLHPAETRLASCAIHGGDQMRSRRALFNGKLFNKETNFIRVESFQKTFLLLQLRSRQDVMSLIHANVLDFHCIGTDSKFVTPPRIGRFCDTEIISS